MRSSAGVHAAGRCIVMVVALAAGPLLPSSAQDAPPPAPPVAPVAGATGVIGAAGSTGTERAAPADPIKPVELSLDDAIRLALQRNLDLAVEDAAGEAAQFGALASWGSFDPLFSLSGGVTDAEQDPSSELTGAEVLKSNTQTLETSVVQPLTTGGSLSLSYSRDNTKTNSSFSLSPVQTSDNLSVALTQPLLRGAWRRYATSNQRQAEIAWQRQLERRREVRQQVLRAVHDAYWDLHSALRQLEVRELALSLAQEQLDQNRRRLEVGVGTEVDVLQAATTVAEREQELIGAEAEVRAATDRLRQATGAPRDAGPEADWHGDWDVPIDPITPLPDVLAGIAAGVDGGVVDWSAGFGRAVEHRPDLAQRRLDIEAAEIDLLRARSERQSNLDLGLTASSGAVDVDPETAFEQTVAYDFPTAAIALAYSLPLGNRSGRNTERQRRAELRQARLNYDRVELFALTEVRTGARQLELLAEGVEATHTRAGLAERQLAAEQARFAQGLTTTFQVLDFQRQLSEALQAEAAALAAHAKARALSLAAEGLLSEDTRPWTE